MFNLVRVGKEWAGPVFPHPFTSNFKFYAYSGQGNLRLVEFFPTPLTVDTTVFPNMITLCIRLMFNLVRVGKEWAGPVFPHPVKSKGYMCIHDRVRLAAFFADDWLTIYTTVFPHPETFWTRLMFNLVRVGKEWAGPVFPHPITSNLMFYAYSGQGNLRLAEFFPTPLTIWIRVFPHVITFCMRLMLNLVRVGKELAAPVFPHPLKSNGYMCIHDRVRLGVFFHRRFTICTTVFPQPISFWTRLLFNLVRVGKEWASPVFSHPRKSKGYICIHDRVRLAEFSADD